MGRLTDDETLAFGGLALCDAIESGRPEDIARARKQFHAVLNRHKRHPAETNQPRCICTEDMSAICDCTTLCACAETP